MKQPKSKPHFISVAVPVLKWPTEAIAVCGEWMKSAHYVVALDSLPDLFSVDELRKTRGLCEDCRALKLEHQYVYVIREGGMQQ